jgi:hypothetical protein
LLLGNINLYYKKFKKKKKKKETKQSKRWTNAKIRQIIKKKQTAFIVKDGSIAE